MPRLLRRPGHLLCRHAEGRRARLSADLRRHLRQGRLRQAVRLQDPATADLLNDRVIPFYDEHAIPLQRVLTDRGTEYCGTHDRHEYELYLAVENIDPSRTKARSPQTNGIVERFHKTMLDEFYRVAFRKKLYATIDHLQADLDAWMCEFNEARPHQGKWCFGKTPMRTFLDVLPLAREKSLQGAAADQPTAA